MSVQALGSIGFIGAGRLGQTLAVALAKAGLDVVAVHSRSMGSAQALAHRVSQVGTQVPMVGAEAQAVVDACDAVFITVNDDQIEAVARSVTWRAGQAVIHCSGATELNALAHAQAAGALTGGLHPLHTFGDVDTALAGLPGCSAAVEAADEGLRAALMGLARSLAMQPFELPSGARALYHASAHYAGSLVVTLMDEAVRHWARLGVAPQQALDALLPLLRSTVRAIESRGLGPGMAGVVARGDVGTLARHLEALEAVGLPERGLYAQLSERSVRLALESGRITGEQARALRALLVQAGG